MVSCDVDEPLWTLPLISSNARIRRGDKVRSKQESAGRLRPFKGQISEKNGPDVGDDSSG